MQMHRTIFFVSCKVLTPLHRSHTPNFLAVFACLKHFPSIFLSLAKIEPKHTYSFTHSYFSPFMYTLESLSSFPLSDTIILIIDPLFFRCILLLAQYMWHSLQLPEFLSQQNCMACIKSAHRPHSPNNIPLTSPQTCLLHLMNSLSNQGNIMHYCPIFLFSVEPSFDFHHILFLLLSAPIFNSVFLLRHF